MNNQESHVPAEPFSSYAYDKRQGVLPISWETFFRLCKGLAVALSSYEPSIILGVARGGLYAATQLSHLLQAELYTIRLTRRFRDQVVSEVPQWIVRPPEVVKDQRVLIVDEICSKGITLSMIKEEVAASGASDIRSAVLYAHEQGKEVPDYIGIISDQLILNPWDREILKDGAFVMHPEYAYALEQQGLMPDFSFLLGLQPFSLAKSR